MEYTTESTEETKNLGRKIGTELSNRENALVLGLQGELGAGKTTFIQGLAKGLGIQQRILSPTFILTRQYDLADNSNYETFYHFDLYRLEEDVEQELDNLGFFEVIKDPKNIVAIEWAQKAGEFLPEDTIWIKFKYLNNEERKIYIE